MAPEREVTGLPGQSRDDFERDVWCLLGMPLDACTLDRAVTAVCNAVQSRQRLVISTPNVNFLMLAFKDAAFRATVVHSDLNLVDGQPLVWLARMLGMPLRSRVAGSDLFDALRRRGATTEPRLAVYFFGGEPGVAAAACQALQAERAGLDCAGFHDPGFVPVAAMSQSAVLDRINASGADFLILSLGAAKGQAWIARNQARLQVPVVSHLGAVINFTTGRVQRAPVWVRRLGLEWAWRIREEPSLWRRYARDGVGLLRLLFTHVFPLMLWRCFFSRHARADEVTASYHCEMVAGESRVRLSGAWSHRNLNRLRGLFRELATGERPVALDLSATIAVDAAFLGLLLVLQKHLESAGGILRVIGISPRLRRLFRWHGVGHLELGTAR